MLWSEPSRSSLLSSGAGKLWQLPLLLLLDSTLRCLRCCLRCTALQDVTDKQHRGYFVDLFVRVSNAVAINMYTKASRLRPAEQCVPLRLVGGSEEGQQARARVQGVGHPDPVPSNCRLPAVWLHCVPKSAGLLQQ